MALGRTSKSTQVQRPGLLDRLRNKKQAKVTTTQSTNPITGTTTTTQSTKTHPRGYGHRGHGGRGPLATDTETHYTSTNSTGAVHHQHRTPSMGDKVSGAMLKLRGSLTHRSGQKAAGTRRMRGTDGRGSHRV